MLRTPLPVNERRRRNVLSLDQQLTGTNARPIATMKAEDLERKIKDETGRSIHINYKNRSDKRKHIKDKTVIVDLMDVPDAQFSLDAPTKSDISNAIKRSYVQLLPIKEIDPHLFDKNMKKISKNMKNAKSKNQLMNIETDVYNNITQFKKEAINSIKSQGLISNSEYEMWSK